MAPSVTRIVKVRHIHRETFTTMYSGGGMVKRTEYNDYFVPVQMPAGVFRSQIVDFPCPACGRVVRIRVRSGVGMAVRSVIGVLVCLACIAAALAAAAASESSPLLALGGLFIGAPIAAGIIGQRLKLPRTQDQASHKIELANTGPI